MKSPLYFLTMLLGVVLAVHLSMNGKVGAVLNNARVGNAACTSDIFRGRPRGSNDQKHSALFVLPERDPECIDFQGESDEFEPCSVRIASRCRCGRQRLSTKHRSHLAG